MRVVFETVVRRDTRLRGVPRVTFPGGAFGPMTRPPAPPSWTERTPTMNLTKITHTFGPWAVTYTRDPNNTSCLDLYTWIGEISYQGQVVDTCTDEGQDPPRIEASADWAAGAAQTLHYQDHYSETQIG